MYATCPQGPKEKLRFLVAPFTEMESRQAEVWERGGGLNGNTVGKMTSLRESQSVSTWDTQKISKTPVHWVEVQRLMPFSAFSHFQNVF